MLQAFLYQNNPIKRFTNFKNRQEIATKISGETPLIEEIAQKKDEIDGKIPPI